MSGILENLIQESKAAGVPIKITLEIGCPCKIADAEAVPTTPVASINTEADEPITTEANENLTEEIN